MSTNIELTVKGQRKNICEWVSFPYNFVMEKQLVNESGKERKMGIQALVCVR